VTLLVRTARSEAETVAALREAIRTLDPNMPIFNVRTLETDLANQRWPLVVAGSTFGLFAGIGLLLSAVGLFGLTSYTVAGRMREMALRMALGAQPGPRARQPGDAHHTRRRAAGRPATLTPVHLDTAY
jgi:hypothetical protein